MQTIRLKLISALFFTIFSLTAKAQDGHSNNCLVNSEEWYLYTEDKLNLYIHEFGQGDEPVLVLHGGFGAEHSYLLPALIPIQDKFHFIAFDQRGSLRSPAPDSVLTFDKMLDDIEKIQRELKIEKLTILGHSMGTRLAMAYAVKHPNKVKKLILTGSLTPVTRNEKMNEMTIHYLENRDIVSEVREKALPKDAAQWSAKDYSYNWRISFASTQYDVSKWKQKIGGVAYYNQHSANLIYPTAPERWNYVEELKKSGIPITVINGDHDFLDFTAKPLNVLVNQYIKENEIDESEKESLRQLNPRHWSDYTDDLPNLKLKIIKNAGHNAWIDQPGTFKKYLFEALKD